ncbi:hypothetical protein F0185_06680 [Massilia sp. CCM 8692]|uniref:Uncharacterized protein n=1 Tax=Massilia rubra TaxID=2607910 RepID=A0ABX0LKU7_9BURK|nr:hypothetical protein [Massilia rubra]
MTSSIWLANAGAAGSPGISAGTSAGAAITATASAAAGGAGVAAGAPGSASPPQAETQADTSRQTLKVAEKNRIGSPEWFLSVATLNARNHENVFISKCITFSFLDCAVNTLPSQSGRAPHLPLQHKLPSRTGIACRGNFENQLTTNFTAIILTPFELQASAQFRPARLPACLPMLSRPKR